MTDTPEALSGEQRLQARRKRLWLFCAGGFAAAMAVGFVTGLASDLFAAGTLPAWSLYLLWVLALACFTWFSWEYFRRVDELDVMDNLWAAMFAFYFYAAGMPTWWLFHDMGLVAEVDHIAIYLGSGAVFFIAYGLRKLGLR